VKKSALAVKGTEMKMGQAGDALGHFSWKKGVNLTNSLKTPNPGRFPEGKAGENGRLPGRVFL